MTCWRHVLLACLVQCCFCQELTVLPRAYRLYYLFDMEPKYNYSFFGTAEIDFHAQSLPKTLQVHLSELYILDDRVKITGQNASILHSTLQDETLNLELGAPLLENEMYTLSVPFFGFGNSSKHGVVSDHGVNERTLISFCGQHYHMAFPVLEPTTSIRSTFTISIAHNATYIALSNMPNTNDNRNNIQTFLQHFPWAELYNQINKGESDFVWTHFETSHPMTSAMLGFIVTNAVQIEPPGNDTWRQTAVNIWRRPLQSKQAAATSAIIGNMFSIFESILETKYPLPKIDVVTIPDLHSPCLKVWGLLVCSEEDLLYDKIELDWFMKEKVIERLARIVSGQWFGNMMVMRTPAQNWLTEGLCKYAGLLLAQRLQSQWSLTDHYAIQEHLEYVKRDANKASFALATVYEVARNVASLSELAASKAYLLLRMNRILFSEHKFKTAVSSFLSGNVYLAADVQALWSQDALSSSKEALPHTPLVKFMSTWSLNEGFPVLNVTRDYGAYTMAVHQRRMAGLCPQKQYESWWIPLSILVKYSPARVEWLLPDRAVNEFKLHVTTSDWVVVNHDLIVPARVNYDEKNWLLLTEELMTSHENIPETARAMLVSDAFALAWVGQLNYSIAIGLSNYLQHESSWGPFLAFFDAIERIDMMLQRQLEYTQLQYYLRHIIYRMHNLSMGIDQVTQPDIFANKLQSKVLYWACHVHILRCRENAMKLFDVWLSAAGEPDDRLPYTHPIQPSVRHCVLGVGAAMGGARAWRVLWRRAHAAPTHAARLPLLLATVHTTNYNLLLRTLDMVLSNAFNVRRSHRAQVLQEALRRTVNFPVIKNFIYKNTVVLKHVLGPYMGDVVFTLASRIRTEKDLIAFSKWVESSESSLIEFELLIKQGKQIARSNIVWDKKHSNNVIDILRQYQRMYGPKIKLLKRRSNDNEVKKRSNNLKDTFFGIIKSIKISSNESNVATATFKMAAIFFITFFCLK